MCSFLQGARLASLGASQVDTGEGSVCRGVGTAGGQVLMVKREQRRDHGTGCLGVSGDLGKKSFSGVLATQAHWSRFSRDGGEVGLKDAHLFSRFFGAGQHSNETEGRCKADTGKTGVFVCFFIWRWIVGQMMQMGGIRSRWKRG